MRSPQQLKLEATAWAGKPSAHARQSLGLAAAPGAGAAGTGLPSLPGHPGLFPGVSSKFTFQRTDFLLSAPNIPLRSLSRQFKSFKRQSDKKKWHFRGKGSNYIEGEASVFPHLSPEAERPPSRCACGGRPGHTALSPWALRVAHLWPPDPKCRVLLTQGLARGPTLASLVCGLPAHRTLSQAGFAHKVVSVPEMGVGGVFGWAPRLPAFGSPSPPNPAQTWPLSLGCPSQPAPSSSGHKAQAGSLPWRPSSDPALLPHLGQYRRPRYRGLCPRPHHLPKLSKSALSVNIFEQASG